MKDISLLQALETKESYDKIVPYIKPHTVSKFTRQIIKDLGEYYEATGGEYIDPAAFGSWFRTVQHRSQKELFHKPYIMIFDKWIETDPNVDVEIVLKEYVKLDFFTRLLNLTNQAVSGDASIDKVTIQELLDEYNELAVGSCPDDVLLNEVSSDLAGLITERQAEGAGLEWRLEELNVSVGPLRKGNFVEIAAYVDSGKTTMVSSEVTHMASQLGPDDYVLWVNNEEEGGAVRLRTCCSALGIPSSDIYKDPTGIAAKYHTALGKENRIRIVDDATISVHDLDKICEKIKPKLIVIDMLDKVQGFESSKLNEVGRLQKIYQWGREKAKQWGPVIVTSQVDGTGSDQRWIAMSQLAGSRVVKQGEADVIITIGRLLDEDPGEEDRRYLHIPKNKLPGGDRSEETERNGRWEIYIHKPIARYKGIARGSK